MDVNGRRPHVVVGLDGSDGSQAALAWARFAAGTGGTVHAVHADPRAADRAGAAAQVGSARLIEQRARDLEAWATHADGPAVDVDRRLEEGDPADALLRVADDVGADLVAVGVHARTRIAPRTLGRVTAKLVQRTDRPLAVVRPGPPSPPAEGSVVVAGVGRGPATAAALSWAADFAAVHGASLSLIHAVSRHPVFAEDGVLDVIAFYVDRQLLHDWALDDLAAVADQLQAATESEVPLSWSAPDGRPGPVLVNAGADAALLVVGRHDDGALGVVPTTALHHVLTHASCPVVVVPAEAGS